MTNWYFGDDAHSISDWLRWKHGPKFAGGIEYDWETDVQSEVVHARKRHDTNKGAASSQGYYNHQSGAVVPDGTAPNNTNCFLAYIREKVQGQESLNPAVSDTDLEITGMNGRTLNKSEIRMCENCVKINYEEARSGEKGTQSNWSYTADHGGNDYIQERNEKQNKCCPEDWECFGHTRNLHSDGKGWKRWVCATATSKNAKWNR